MGVATAAGSSSRSTRSYRKLRVALVRCVRKKGGLFCYVPPDQFRLLQGEEDLTLYRFNTELAKHIFCKHCGIHAFGHPRSTPDLYLVNVRCLDDFDLETEEYEVKLFDGRNWEAAFKARRESG